jgi:integrin-linked kinase
MSISSHYHAHKPNVPIIQEDVFGWVREGNAFQTRVWLDDSEHDLNIGDDHAFSLLHWAAKGGHISIVDMLLARGARVNATNMGDDTPLHLAASQGHREVVVKLLAKRAEVNIPNEHGNTPLHYACFWGYEQVAADLVQYGAFVMLCNKRGLTSIDVCQPQCRQSIIGL